MHAVHISYRSSVFCMLCDSKLNLYFVGNIVQQGGQPGEGVRSGRGQDDRRRKRGGWGHISFFCCK